ncbi:lipocalin-like domain-containing protein [Desulfobotulus sp.]|uniref:lipocalin-like domain-containing protein n=1 Tax=Desulfobotulus sp. TaxID=1940337 RepID=UPI002A36AFE7|nr:lipocalin-like domain-containing protein [Desulfobotulus sp.]MDY0163101.1 lipocalin-like domain-containing protein [Desulfobotulus sp.]
MKIIGIFCLCLLPFWTFAKDFPRVEGPCDLRFPEDHGPHRDFRTEWWYYTGNVRTEAGRDFGYQLTFFRSRLVAPGRIPPSENPSAWRAEEVWMAHAAVSDMQGKRHVHASRLMRENPGLVQVSMEKGHFTLTMGSWRLGLGEGRHTLTAESPDFAFHLDLVPEKPLILHGEGGYSLKGNAPERASCYYSFTRLQTEGMVEMGGQSYRVRGLSWMDHEFSSEPLDPEAVGWDWFSIQLADGYDLMVFQVRAKDGSGLMTSGTLVDPEGKSLPIPMKDVALSVLSTWRSPGTGGLYPASWRLKIPTLDLVLFLESRLEDQEMRSQETPGSVVYWEGSIAVSGRHRGKSVKGQGYAELTGYAGSLAGRL